MPTFMQSLGANPAGGSGMYGQPGQSNNDDALGIVRQLKDREMEDFKNKAGFMSDLSIKQDRLRRLYGLDGSSQGQEQQSGQPNVVMGHDPSQMTGYQKGELGVRQQQLGQEQQAINQRGKLGQEALNIKGDQEKLNQQKSDQINAQKTADMQRKIEESNQKIELAKKALEDKTANAEAQLAAHKELAAAVEERHKLELAQKDHQFTTANETHQKAIKDMEDKLKQSQHSKTTTKISASGQEKTTETTRGSAADTIQVQDKDGNTFEIPADKKDEWDSTHAGISH
jgi:hypothetical protein